MTLVQYFTKLYETVNFQSEKKTANERKWRRIFHELTCLCMHYGYDSFTENSSNFKIFAKFDKMASFLFRALKNEYLL